MSRGRRTARDNVSMELFPFLAVLICTMGSLILLLVVMAQQARARATTPPTLAMATPSATSSVAESSMLETADTSRNEATRQRWEEFQFQAEMLRPSYGTTLEQLQEKRLELSHIEEHSRRLAEQAGRLQAEAKAIAQADDSQKKLDELKQIQAMVHEQIAMAKTDLDQLDRELQGRKKTYALVPYDGPNGTSRRPIYIECLEDRVILQPEGIVLEGDDFLEPLGPDNPLAVALRARREYMLRHKLIDVNEEPYPLIVIRPKGAAAYAATRHALTGWEGEFGYELLEQDVVLRYDPPDNRLAEILEEVIHDSRKKREFIRSIEASERRQSHGSEGYRVSAQGGFERIGNSDDSHRSGRTGSEKSRSERSRAGSERGGLGDVQNVQAGSRDSRDPSTPPEFSGIEGYPTKTSNRREATNDMGFDSPDNGAKGRGTAKNGGNTAGNSIGQLGGPTNGNSVAGTAGGSRVSETTAREPVRGIDGGPDTRGPSTPAGTERNGSAAGVGEPNGETAPSTGSAAGTMASVATTASDASVPATTAISATFGDKARSADSDRGSTSPSGGSLAQTRGKNWALPEEATRAIGVRRQVSVLCDPRRLILLPEMGTREKAQIFNVEGNYHTMVDKFVTSLRTRLDSWGTAGRGIYWKPVLQVEVTPDAEANFEELVEVLRDSGIQVVRRR